MTYPEIIKWLLKGDVSIKYQVHRDLLGENRKELQNRIEHEGWGKKFLVARNENGHWGREFYQPKWTSTHYTLLDLRNLEISPKCKIIKESINLVLQNEKGQDGGINPGKTITQSDVCVNGMILNYCCYFGAAEKDLKSIVDFILGQQMPDGGFNCRSNRSGAKHSSLHTTLSVLEGILEYKRNNYTYRLNNLIKAEKESQEFILQHRLYKSDKTGKIIDPGFLRLTYPSRWRYDILRALDYFRLANHPYDERMNDALEIILKKRNKENTWNLYAHHPGQMHFAMEEVGKPSRWNTLRTMRVLNHFK